MEHGGIVARSIKFLTDYVDATATVTDKTANITSLALAGHLQDGWGGGGVNHMDLTLALDQLRINSPAAQTNGTYSRLSYSVSRQQRLTADATLLLAVNGQQASKNLDSSEKFVLGGINGVRAYPQGEASGDEGYKAVWAAYRSRRLWLGARMAARWCLSLHRPRKCRRFGYRGWWGSSLELTPYNPFAVSFSWLRLRAKRLPKGGLFT
jgi:hypothetical protein